MYADRLDERCEPCVSARGNGTWPVVRVWWLLVRLRSLRHANFPYIIRHSSIIPSISRVISSLTITLNMLSLRILLVCPLFGALLLHILLFSFLLLCVLAAIVGLPLDSCYSCPGVAGRSPTSEHSCDGGHRRTSRDSETLGTWLALSLSIGLSLIPVLVGELAR
jgi:hypothetical protein